MAITQVKFGNGNIRFNSKVDAVPATSKTTGNVTINNAGQEEIPAHYETSFMISVYGEERGIEFSNVFHWNDIVPIDRADAPYREIEDAAARRLAPMLRAVADQVDQEMAAFDAREKAKQSQD
ncbi:hypothetical protein [Sinorhizobium meliloti]|uniref:hypothetical protein n=1 Tax=Rhizobium meliloti TaxID=382 RepID=UPI003D64E635